MVLAVQVMLLSLPSPLPPRKHVSMLVPCRPAIRTVVSGVRQISPHPIHLKSPPSAPLCAVAAPIARVAGCWPSQATQVAGSCPSWSPAGCNATNQAHEDLEDAQGDVDVREFAPGDPGCAPRVAGRPRVAVGVELIHLLQGKTTLGRDERQLDAWKNRTDPQRGWKKRSKSNQVGEETFTIGQHLNPQAESVGSIAAASKLHS
mmetsp:Transcript_5849/g.36255  ORF Transcript_5849/g.36255 Transcript_5849/m.36255 type:complete len:204 (+) Transcript_5849:6639-7250(+)